MKLESMENQKSENRLGRAPLLWLVLLGIVAVAGLVAFKLCERELPQVSLLQEVVRIGSAQQIGVAVADAKSGVRSLEVSLRQGDRLAVLDKKEFPRGGGLFVSGGNRVEETVSVTPTAQGFTDGKAELVVRARDYSWWHWRDGNTVTATYPVTIDTRPPNIVVTASTTYIKPGGSGVVVFRVDEPVSRVGVKINDDYHPGYPLPRHGEQVYGATIGIRYDTEKLKEAYVSATDLAGNEGRSSFGMILRKAAQKSDRINISQGFLDMKLPEFGSHYPDLTGTPVEKYLFLNNQVRQENNRRIAEACSSSSPERYWQGVFLRLPRSSRKAGYADHRTYYNEGQEIDHQVHLGIDLASTRHAAVEAANRGKVVLADYLGIYGNTVILDHGQGLYSLYSHLSQIDVTPGSMVEKGAPVGISGNSGMAGGDHLHFSMLVNGIFVNPVEWWDPHWLKVSIESFL